MDKQVFYRIEHADSGSGPFWHRLAGGKASRLVDYVNRHRDPLDFPRFVDYILELRDKGVFVAEKGFNLPARYAFGWSTEKQMIRFCNPKRKLKHYGGGNGFRYVCYIGAPEFEFPDGQVLIDKTKCELVT